MFGFVGAPRVVVVVAVGSLLLLDANAARSPTGGPVRLLAPSSAMPSSSESPYLTLKKLTTRASTVGGLDVVVAVELRPAATSVLTPGAVRHSFGK